MGILEGKVVIVTGASSGIGEATALEAAKEGAKVVLGARREDRLQDVVSRIEKSGGTAIFTRTDVTIEKDIINLVDLAVREFGKLDCAFNNAGIFEICPLTEASDESYDRIMNTNVRSVFWCIKHEIPEMKKNGSGAIVNCASMAGLISAPGLGIYTSSKAGILGLSKTAALENAEHDIRINSVHPGLIKTEIWDDVEDQEEITKTLSETAPMKRSAMPIEVAKPVVFLMSDNASYITGTELVIDGGFTAQ